ncbi:hypothetical protein, partial [Aquabacterium sp.]|uniref:hypothetical protein n=1 Tax=Aquabacterium sp. TaxID=1872578 RepID=UPI0025C48A1D
GLDLDKMYVYDPMDVNNPGINSSSNRLALTPIVKAKPTHLFAALPYLRNIVVVASARNSMVERAYKHEVMKKYGAYPGFLFYHAGTKMKEKEEALEFFKKNGFVVVDLTVKQDWEIDDTPVLTTPVIRKPKKEGLVALNCVRNASDRINTRWSLEEEADRIKDPEFVIQLKFSKDDSTNRLHHWEHQASLYILDLFGAKGGITNNRIAHSNWINKGAKDFEEYVIDNICDYISNSAAIKEFWAFNPRRILDDYVNRYMSKKGLIRLIYSTPALRAEHALVNNMTEEDKKYVYLWEHCLKKSFTKAVDLTTLLNAIPLDPINKQVIDKIQANELIDILDYSALQTVLTDVTKSSHAQKALEVFISILK